jgi:hypothetical protein
VLSVLWPPRNEQRARNDCWRLGPYLAKPRRRASLLLSVNNFTPRPNPTSLESTARIVAAGANLGARIDIGEVQADGLESMCRPKGQWH